LRTGEYNSKGKLLISGEYLVLHGARALSVPLKFGQSMKITQLSHPGIIRWETHVKGDLWFKASFHGRELELGETTHYKTAMFIHRLLIIAGKIQPALISDHNGIHISNHINFDINWGLGSSSSLISNMAYWLNTDLFSFYRMVFDGSGYDVFSARAAGPLLYSLADGHPSVEQAALHASVTDYLYFIYLGKKQDSQDSVRKFREKELFNRDAINEVSGLTGAMVNEKDPGAFMELIRRHESVISEILATLPVKQELFPDFNGEIKSLGAWGGDFVMACSFMSPGEIKEYFAGKGLHVVFSWKEIVY
jgi:mevalonate kinase